MAGFDETYDAALTRGRIEELSDEDARPAGRPVQRGRAAAASRRASASSCALPVVAEKSQEWIILGPEDLRAREEVASNLLMVAGAGA